MQIITMLEPQDRWTDFAKKSVQLFSMSHPTSGNLMTSCLESILNHVIFKYRISPTLTANTRDVHINLVSLFGRKQSKSLSWINSTELPSILYKIIARLSLHCFSDFRSISIARVLPGQYMGWFVFANEVVPELLYSYCCNVAYCMWTNVYFR